MVWWNRNTSSFSMPRRTPSFPNIVLEPGIGTTTFFLHLLESEPKRTYKQTENINLKDATPFAFIKENANLFGALHERKLHKAVGQGNQLRSSSLCLIAAYDLPGIYNV
ncbi:hypothetical protein C1H46_034832 [Malus baccata]|uniref:Uncharacterized protein n=1 Tax=Malus baccata TaxID=106549 RepID=A0A540KZF3_MALBA|nr:hypothetical protein C1H46_034832 [Malus baccata]